MRFLASSSPSPKLPSAEANEWPDNRKRRSRIATEWPSAARIHRAPAVHSRFSRKSGKPDMPVSAFVVWACACASKKTLLALSSVFLSAVTLRRPLSTVVA